MDTKEQVQIPSTTSDPVILPALDDSCCLEDTILHPCPMDHSPSPLHPQCQDPSVSCSSLPLSCISCTCSYSCKYGSTSNASCSAPPQAKCEGVRTFSLQFQCSYCYLTDDETHMCSTRDSGCRSSGCSPPAGPTSTLPTEPPGRKPSAWASRSSPRRRSATGLRAAAGKLLFFFQSPWVGSGLTDSTWGIGRRGLGSCSVLGGWGFGHWWMWFWYLRGMLGLLMDHSTYEKVHCCNKIIDKNKQFC